MCKIGQEDALVGAYRRFVREKADAPILRWFQARAIYRNADRLRREGNFQGAVAIYQKSRAIFGEYLALMPNHRDASKFWQALCELSMARCSADTGDLEAAAEQQCAASAGRSSHASASPSAPPPHARCGAPRWAQTWARARAVRVLCVYQVCRACCAC